jgi:hypothetical protein
MAWDWNAVWTTAKPWVLGTSPLTLTVLLSVVSKRIRDLVIRGLKWLASKTWLLATGRTASQKEHTELKKEVDEIKQGSHDVKSILRMEMVLEAMQKNVDHLANRVGKIPEDFNEKLAKRDDKTNEDLGKIQEKWNLSFAEVLKEVRALQARTGALGEAAKSPALPEPIARFVTDGVLWLQYKEHGQYQPYCEACASKGARNPITPRKETVFFFIKCTQCGFWTRIKIDQYYSYQAGNHYDVDNGSGTSSEDQEEI